MAEQRRARTLWAHLQPPEFTSELEPTNTIQLSFTASGGNQTTTTTVRIGDVSLVVPRPIPQLSHAVPALYLAGKGQVSIYIY